MTIAIAASYLSFIDLMPVVWLYIGPEVLLPVTSALAAIVGIALMFWNKVVGAVRGVWRFVSRQKAATAADVPADQRD